MIQNSQCPVFYIGINKYNMLLHWENNKKNHSEYLYVMTLMMMIIIVSIELSSFLSSSIRVYSHLVNHEQVLYFIHFLLFVES